MKEVVDGNPVLRRKLYAGYATIGLGLGSASVAFGALEMSPPPWLVATLAVYAYVGGVFGFGARSKVDAEPVIPE